MAIQIQSVETIDLIKDESVTGIDKTQLSSCKNQEALHLC